MSENNKLTLEYKNDYQVIAFDLLKHKFRTNRIALLTMTDFMLIENIY